MSGGWTASDQKRVARAALTNQKKACLQPEQWRATFHTLCISLTPEVRALFDQLEGTELPGLCPLAERHPRTHEPEVLPPLPYARR